jgi:N-acetylglucosamine kinase-like BadF-type ATPase
LVSGLPILGVDAGGSATRAVLVRDGDVVARFDSGPLNLLLDGDAFDRLVALIEESGAAAAGLGLAGLRGRGEAELLEHRLGAATGVPVVVADDTEAALVGAFEGGPGIVVIAGTGSNAFGRAVDGHAARVGGYGYLVGDEGSAYWIASQALRAALHSHDGTGPKSTLLEDAVTRAYGLDFDAIVRHVYTNSADRQLIAHLARQVMAVDDPVVAGIIDDGADFLAQMAHALRQKLGPDLPVAMHGGIFQDRNIRARFMKATGAVEPARSPEFGAVLLAQAGAAERDMGWAQQ